MTNLHARSPERKARPVASAHFFSASEAELGPPPFAPGEPYEWNLCPQRTPPCGFEFMGAKPTDVAFMMPCPACLQGWVGLQPDGSAYGYVIAYDLGCTRDCPAEEISWWHQFSLGNLPTPEPDERDRRYAAAVAKGVIRDLLNIPENHNPARVFARAAYRVGQAIALGRLKPEAVAPILVRAGVAIGLPLPEAAAIAKTHALAGTAAPMRAPR